MRENVILGAAAEGHLAGGQNGENHTEGPDIHLRTFVGLPQEDLRRQVVGRSELFLQPAARRPGGCEAKVAYDELLGLVVRQQNVLALEIAVDEAGGVEMVDGINQLPKAAPRLDLDRASLMRRGIRKRKCQGC